MKDAVFEKLKALYQPIFSEDPIHKKITEDKLKSLHLKAPLRNRIIDYIAKYGIFHFSKQENKSGDVIRFYSEPLCFHNPSFQEFNETVAFIGGYRNRSCSFCGRIETFYIEAFYMNSDGSILNQDHLLIAENLAGFWRYIIDKEYDFHPDISNEIMDSLRNAGWYKGRKINIDPLLEECMDDDIFPTDIQIAFVQEFGGIEGVGLDGRQFYFGNTREYRCFANIWEQQCDTEEEWALQYYGADTLCVGYYDGVTKIWLSPDGQLIIGQKAGGRNLWEGIQCVIGY